MALLGGGVIVEYKFVKAWGVSPSTATGKVVMDTIGGGSSVFDLEAGDYVIYSFGSVASFIGVCTSIGEKLSVEGGRQADFAIADNRIRLDQAVVFAVFNQEDDSPSRRMGRPAPKLGNGSINSGSSGNDWLDFDLELENYTSPPNLNPPVVPNNPMALKRGYWSILPENWSSGAKTFHEQPLTARQILNYAFNGAWGGFGFTRIYHPDLDDVILTGLDYRQGAKLSAIVSDITSKSGLDIRIDGARTLVWGRKGTGFIPLPDASSTDISYSESLSTDATAYRVVGDRIKIQVTNVSLEPDWNPAWEPFIDELAWRREVATVLEIPTGPEATEADEAELSAKSIALTVSQYAKLKNDPDLRDARFYGNTTRNHIPAWTYINEFVYRSYRIPPSASLFGVPLGSLEMADSLLADTTINGEGESATQIYETGPFLSYDPQVPAQAIVKGQPLDQIDGRNIRAFASRRTTNLRNVWQVAKEFEVDPLNMSIRFAVPTFIDGDPEQGESLYINPNKGDGGYTDLTEMVPENSDYLQIVVPNPGYVISPAQVKASFCFLFGNYYSDYGSGVRRDSLRLGGLDLRVLHTGVSIPGTTSLNSDQLRLPAPSGSFREILYEDGTTAEFKASQAAQAVIQRSALLSKGGFMRNGVVGTPLQTAIDSITVSITQSGGITERVDYAKSRASAYLNESTLRRIRKTDELYPAQDQIKSDVKRLELTAKLLRGKSNPNFAATHKNLDDVFSKPIGGNNSNSTKLLDKNSAAPEGGWKAGHLVWVDFEGVPTNSEVSTFKGVLASTPSGSPLILNVCQSGTVPVLCKDSIAINSEIRANPGNALAGASGSLAIGAINHAEAMPPATDEEPVMVMAVLGKSSTPQKLIPLHIISSRPVYIPAPEEAPTEGMKRFWIEWGTINSKIASNWDSHFDINATTFFFAKVNLNVTDESLSVVSWDIITAEEEDAYPPAIWGVDGVRPEEDHYLLGQVFIEESAVNIVNSGGGSLSLSEHLVNLFPGSGAGSVTIQKQFTWIRNIY